MRPALVVAVFVGAAFFAAVFVGAAFFAAFFAVAGLPFGDAVSVDSAAVLRAPRFFAGDSVAAGVR